MSSTKARLILMVALLAFEPASAQVTGRSYKQVDYYQDGRLAVQYSAWGEFTVTYIPTTEIRWFNVVENPSSNSRWIVQNLPLWSLSQTGGTEYSSSAYFDLGVSNSTPKGSISAGFVVSSIPATTRPTSFDGFESVSVGTSQAIINNGVPSGITTLNPAALNNAAVWPPLAGQEIEKHVGMPNVVQEHNFCGPGAATNSFHWLAMRLGIDLGQTLLQSQTELAGFMMNANIGNWDDKEVIGKLKFINNHARLKPMSVHYTGGVMLPLAGNFVDPDGTAINDGAISWQWIQDQMKMGQDVELMTDSHWVVLEGLISWDGVHLLEYRDDPFQNGAATTAAQQTEINQRHIWTYLNAGDNTTNIGNGEEVLKAAVAESGTPTEDLGLVVWFVDNPGRTIYKITDPGGALIRSFPVPAAATNPTGLGVGDNSLCLLDSGTNQIFRMDAHSGVVQEVFPSPSTNAIGIGYGNIVPNTRLEMFVVTNDPPGGKLYWVNPFGGSVIHQCDIGLPNLRDAGAAPLGSDATGVWVLQSNGTTTSIYSLQKLSCAFTLVATFAWDGWGLGAGATGNEVSTIVRLYASDLGAQVIHVIDSKSGVEKRTIPLPPGVLGINIRGVGANENIHIVPALGSWSTAALIGLIMVTAAIFILRRSLRPVGEPPGRTLRAG